MMKTIPEREWKLLRSMKEAKLNKLCEQILKTISSVIINKGNNNHKAYLEVWDKLQTADREIAISFDDVKRSNAILILAAWKRYGLLTESELNEFSEETRSTIRAITE